MFRIHKVNEFMRTCHKALPTHHGTNKTPQSGENKNGANELTQGDL